ncbi:hypothetical protein [Ohtaekwangia koreensis]|uniref:Uncharacterized protein n=1 Tax=Ohtaekwangia koreensis TaxID=688867 RepID=A0A1T5J7A9_9BACT|nr:hypothetical protein [Ohtaekwangia koreensis]SKC47305.1 hypothetical protein SAMN05660236_0836 [Ohtaekwangia koreensis]
MRFVQRMFSFLVETEGQLVSKKFDLDKNVKIVHGILFSSNRKSLLFHRGSQRVEISGEEVIAENFESCLFMSGLAVAPNEKFKTFGEQEGKQADNGIPAGNGEVKIQYKDTANPDAEFAPYQVNMYLQCEMK